MTTASVLISVSSTWNSNSEKCDKEEKFNKCGKDLAAIASRELRESPATRDQAVRIMREWILKNPDIRNVRTDDSFILRFLRQKKYSIPMAQQTLLKYLNLRKYYPTIFMSLDCIEAKINDIIESGYIMVSPLRDSCGRRIIIYNIAKFDASKYSCWDMSKIHVVIYESLLHDNADQICGFTHIGDGSGVTTSHIMNWNPVDFARLFKWGEQSYPIRHKEVHAINVPTAMKYIVDFALSKVTPKMADRLHIHKTLKSLHSKIDSSCLPTAYGGQLTNQELINYTKKILLEQRKSVLELDNMEILSTRGIISSRNKQRSSDNGMSSIDGSFRKLEID